MAMARQNSEIVDDSFRPKQSLIIDSCTEILQKLLIKKCDQWSKKTKSLKTKTDPLDFFSAHPNTKWTPQEQRAIDSKDIHEFDTSLCCKWLTGFKWNDNEGLSENELTALKCLRHLRNNFKHSVQQTHITKDDYAIFCINVKQAALALGASDKNVKKIFSKADNVITVDSAKLKAEKTRLAKVSWTFKTHGILGSGDFGIVLSVLDNIDNQNYAIKLIPNRKVYPDLVNFEQKIAKEAQNWAKLSHPNVVRYQTSDRFEFSLDRFQEVILWERENSQIGPNAREFLLACFHEAKTSGNPITGLYIQTEVCGQTLRRWLNKQAEVARSGKNKPTRPEDDRLKNQMAEGLINGINHIHEKKLIHRDLRPENIFFARGGYKIPLKIGDFGLSNQSKLCEPATMTKAIGNIFYRAPEINEPNPNKPEMAKYGQSADLFALGLIISEIFDPVLADEVNEKFNKIKYVYDTGSKIQSGHPLVHDLILQLTHSDPNQRQKRDSENKPVPIKWNSKAVDVFVDKNDQEYGLGQLELCPRMGISKINSMELMSTSSGRELLHYDDIVLLRKLLQRDKIFWKPEIIADFFYSLDQNPRFPQDFSNHERPAFNKTIYKMREQSPNLFTKANLETALVNVNCRHLLSELDRLKFV